MSTAQAIRWMQGKDGALNFFPNTAVGIYKEGRRMCVEISRNTIQPNGQPQNFLPEKPLLRTQKDIIAYLSRYRYADLRIQRKCEELSLWRQRALQITPAYSELPGGRTGRDKVQTAVDHICEIEEEINREIDAFVEIRRKYRRLFAPLKILFWRLFWSIGIWTALPGKNWLKKCITVINGSVACTTRP